MSSQKRTDDRAATFAPLAEIGRGSLYEYAKDPQVGPSAGWPANRDLIIRITVAQQNDCQIHSNIFDI